MSMLNSNHLAVKIDLNNKKNLEHRSPLWLPHYVDGVRNNTVIDVGRLYLPQSYFGKKVIVRVQVVSELPLDESEELRRIEAVDKEEHARKVTEKVLNGIKKRS